MVSVIEVISGVLFIANALMLVGGVSITNELIETHGKVVTFLGHSILLGNAMICALVTYLV